MTLYFPIFLNLSGKPCLVVGGGASAAAKTARLMEAGARVAVVSPELHPDLLAEWQRGSLQWTGRPYRPDDVRNRFLVIAATDDPRVNRQVFLDCEALHIPVNSVDDPRHCRFIMPAVAREGPLQVAVSTSGTCPNLAVMLKRRIQEELLTSGTGRAAAYFASWRNRVKETLPGFAQRRGFWRAVLDSPALELAGKNQRDRAAYIMERLLHEAADRQRPPEPTGNPTSNERGIP